MNDLTRFAVRALLAEREELVFQKLNHNPEYQAVVRRQKESAQALDALLNRLEQDGPAAFCKHSEGEIEKTGYEIKGAYMQGLHDCFYLIGFLNGDEVQV